MAGIEKMDDEVLHPGHASKKVAFPDLSYLTGRTLCGCLLVQGDTVGTVQAVRPR